MTAGSWRECWQNERARSHKPGKGRRRWRKRWRIERRRSDVPRLGYGVTVARRVSPATAHGRRARRGAFWLWGHRVVMWVSPVGTDNRLAAATGSTDGGKEANRDLGQLVEPGGVGGDDGPGTGPGGGGDEEIMGAAGPSLPARVREQDGVDLGDLDVVGLDRDGRQQRLDKRPARRLAPSVRELDADHQLRDRHRCDRDVVFITDHRVVGGAGPLGGNQDGRVENQPFQRRTSGSSPERSSVSSRAHAASAGWLRKRSLTTRPETAAAGAMLATARPRRSTRKVSPSRST